jgi:hypothetical protein
VEGSRIPYLKSLDVKKGEKVDYHEEKLLPRIYTQNGGAEGSKGSRVIAL